MKLDWRLKDNVVTLQDLSAIKSVCVGGGGGGGGNQNKYLHLVIYRICFRKKEAWIINNVVNVL